jgi:hypothetical protein
MYRRLFCGAIVAKKAMTICYHRLLLWRCWSEEGNNLLMLPSSLC